METAQGHLKRRLKNRLILRASHDFKTKANYAAFVARVCTELNTTLRSAAFAEESKRLRRLPATRFPEAQEVAARVSQFSTVRIKNHAYSVPSRLIGTWVQANVTETEVAIYYAQQFVVTHPRAQGQEPKIDYRHIIGSLVKKPGAFKSCIYREHRGQRASRPSRAALAQRFRPPADRDARAARPRQNAREGMV